MGTHQLLILLIGFTTGIIVVFTYYYFPIKRLREQIWKLKGQVYFWSRQMPVNKKYKRSRKKSV